MSSITAVTPPDQRLEVLFEELAQLAGQRNAIDGRIVAIVAEVERDELWGATGARSIAGLVAWKLGTSTPNATTIATIAHRSETFPRCVTELREGRLSLDQVGVTAAHAADGSDAHYAELAAVATVNQLRTAVKLEPRPDPDPRPDPQPSITKTSDEKFTWWRIKLAHPEAATFEAALAAHREALITEWKQAHTTGESAPEMPGDLEAFLRLVETSWDAEATRRPHGQHTTVVVHLDIEQRAAALHLGPLLSDDDRRYLTCDVCPHHHRAHHRGLITITGPAEHLAVTDMQGRPLSASSIARAPTRPPPQVPPCPGPTGERANWWWYQPFQPQPPPSDN